MGWTNQRRHAIWVVQRASTGRVIIVYDRKSLAVAHVKDDPSLMWTRMQINQRR